MAGAGIRVGVPLVVLLAAVPADAAGGPKWHPHTEPYRVIVERPLFRPWRRPAPTAEPVMQAAAEPSAPEPDRGERPPPEPDLEFLGTVRHNGRITALVALPGHAEPLRLTVGTEIEGWRVTRVEPTKLVIESDTAYEEYTILE